MGYHRFTLERYTGRNSRFTCPKCGTPHCLSRYIDNETGRYLSDIVGRCDHESKCGYHYTPKQFFKDHPELSSASGRLFQNNTRLSQRVPTSQTPKGQDVGTPAKPVSIIPDSYVERSVKLLTVPSQLVLYLQELIDPAVLELVLDEYKVGVTKSKDVIFFQIDKNNHCRSGKIMRYDSSGHRVKSFPPYWIHGLLRKKGKLQTDWSLTQCLFGEHLLSKYPERLVALVESEKTAIVCAALMPDYIWVATGGKSSGVLEKMQVLKGRKVIVFPDVDAHKEWMELLSVISDMDITVSDIVMKRATPEDIEAQIDIADLLLRWLSAKQRGGNSVSETQRKAIAVTANPVVAKLMRTIPEEFRDKVEGLVKDFDLDSMEIF